MKITYLGHSGFQVELNACVLVFDQISGPLATGDKPVYYFVSHSHGDHYQEKIFQGENASFLLSYDIHTAHPHIVLAENAVVHCGEMEIVTIPSNDEGVAVLVKTAEGNIYHAGDLNDWDWDGEPASWLAWQSRVYEDGLKTLKSHGVDVAFVPLDPRLGKSMGRGVERFVDCLHPGLVLPMHFSWGEGEIQQAQAEAKKQNIPILKTEGETMIWNRQ